MLARTYKHTNTPPPTHTHARAHTCSLSLSLSLSNVFMPSRTYIVVCCGNLGLRNDEQIEQVHLFACNKYVHVRDKTPNDVVCGEIRNTVHGEMENFIS